MNKVNYPIKTNGKIINSFEELERLALNNDADSMYYYGLCFFYGEGCKKNTTEAARFFTLSALSDSKEAFYAEEEY